MNFLKDIKDKLVNDFAEKSDEARNLLKIALKENDYLATPRVLRSIIYLSKGSIEELKKNIEVAVLDTRDVMFRAEYQNNNFNEANKRVRNFNKTFNKSEVEEINVEYISTDYNDKFRNVKWSVYVSIVMVIFYFISPIIKPSKEYLQPFYLIFTLSICIINIFYNMIKKHKYLLCIDFKTQKLKCNYIDWFYRKNQITIDFCKISSCFNKTPSKNGVKMELVIYSDKKSVLTFNEKDDDFEKSTLGQIHCRIGQIKQDYC